MTEISNPSAQASPLPVRRTRPTLLIALGTLFLIQLLLIVWAYWPNDIATMPGGPLLADFVPEQVHSIEIASGEGQSVTLERAADGWVIASTDGYPANGPDVDALLSGLAEVNSNRLVTQTPASHARLQVAEDNFNRRVVLTFEDGARQTIYLGNAGGGGATHIRHGEQDTVYLTNAVVAWDVEPFLSGWVDTTYLSLPAADLHRVLLQNDQGEIELVRNAENRWESPTLTNHDAAASLDQTAAGSLVGQIGFLSLQRILGQSPPADATPVLRLEVDRIASASNSVDDATDDAENEGEDGNSSDDAALEIVTIEFGRFADGETETYFVKSSESEYYVTVLAQTVESLAAFALDDLIAEPADAPAAPPEDAQEDVPADEPADESEDASEGTGE